MDIDTELLAKIIYPYGVPEHLKDHSNFHSYLAKLGGFNLEQLSKEPEHLNTEKTAVLNQMQELAFANYKTFISTAECAREVFQHFNKSEEKLDSLLKSIPQFNEECHEFSDKARNIRAKRFVNTLCLTSHPTLLQILEIPQLMETIIREGMYEETLQLATYVRRFTSNHPNIPILQTILKDIERFWWILMHRLINQLKCDLQFPKCLQICGHLRRMDVLTEMELRLKFLHARNSWLETQLQAISTEDANYHLSKTIEVSRTHLFNIITQYKAVFVEDDSLITSSRQQFNEVLILQAWITNKISEFIKTVEEDLQRGVGQNLFSLLGQCMYFGQSLGRVGADFRAIVAPLFLRTIGNNFANRLCMANVEFQMDMDKFSLSKVNILLTKIPETESKQSSHITPPSSLLEFCPLAYFCNKVIIAFNDLRLCAPLALASSVCNIMSLTLLSMSNTISQFHQREQQALSIEENELFTKFLICFAEYLVPYMQRCLHSIYSPIEIAGFLSIPVHKLQKEGLIFLDISVILAPITDLLPKNIEAINKNEESFQQISNNSEIIEKKTVEEVKQKYYMLKEKENFESNTETTSDDKLEEVDLTQQNLTNDS